MCSAEVRTSSLYFYPTLFWFTDFFFLMYRKLQTLLFFFLILFIYGCVGSLFLCDGFLSSCGKWGPLFIAVRGPLTIAASPVAEHRLQTRRLSNCGSRAQLLRGMWDLPRPGIEPVSPALAGRFSTTVPPGKPWFTDSYSVFYRNLLGPSIELFILVLVLFTSKIFIWFFLF